MKQGSESLLQILLSPCEFTKPTKQVSNPKKHEQMKRKILILTSLCIISLLTWKTQAMNIEPTPIDNVESSIPYGYEEIELRGTLATNTGPNGTLAGVSDDAVYIEFNQDFGNVNISIYNSTGGIVYNTVVNSSMQSVVIIPFSTAASGTYTVELNNANGYADGDFEKN